VTGVLWYKKHVKTRKLSAGDWVKLASFTLAVLLLWFSLYCVSNKAFQAGGGRWPPALDLVTLLYGAASVTLIIVSILAAVLALFGWKALEDKVIESVEKATAKRIDSLENELRGRAAAIQGYLIGENSLTPDALGVTTPVRLAEAISYCEKAYENLKKVGGPAEYLPLNNLVFYHCLLGTTSRRGYLLESARKLRSTGEEHDAPNLQLTYCRAVLQLGTDEKERREACKMVSALLSHPRLTEKEKREAQHLASLCEEQLPRTT
jgi:hypothetical protein